MALDNYEIVTASGTCPGGSGFWNLSVDAPAGKKALGGGWSATDTTNGFTVAECKPYSNGGGWDVRFRKGSGDVSVVVHAVCAST